MQIRSRSLAATSLAVVSIAFGSGAALSDVVHSDHVHKMPKHDAGAPTPTAAPAGAHLTYYGGRVISNVSVVQVLWGSGSYLSNVTSTATPSVATLYQQISNSAYFDWLTEYNTPASGGTNQHIGRGSFAAQVSITPSTTSSTIDDTRIQSEIAAQIDAGHLPAPTTDAAGNVNTYYAVFFPHGKTITQGGSSSCVSGGFCAYHGTFTRNGQHVYYGVHPDMQSGSGCDLGCGNGAVFANQSSVASHELVEAVTDAEVGLATVLGPPLAWYDNTNGEIGDICNAQQGAIVGGDGVTYTVQKEFSNQANNCIVSKTTAGNDFSISASPGSVSIAQGSSASVSVNTATTSGSTQTVNLAVAGAPSGMTATLTPTSVSSGQSATLAISTTSATASGTFTLTVTGTASSGSHSAQVSVTVTSSGGGGGPTALMNGVAVTGLAGASGSQTFFVLNVPSGQASLTFQISGGTGDADLYVRFGAQPTTGTYGCRPYVNGNNETCTFSNPAAGNWYVLLNGYAAYSGVTLKGTFATDSTTPLTSGVAVTGISGASGSQQFWKLTVPAGKTSATFHTSGGTGDADLYVRRGARPSTTAYDCRPYLTGNTETCTFNNPVAADYFVMIRGYAAFSGVTLTGTYSP
jgi:serine protease